MKSILLSIALAVGCGALYIGGAYLLGRVERKQAGEIFAAYNRGKADADSWWSELLLEGNKVYGPPQTPAPRKDIHTQADYANSFIRSDIYVADSSDPIWKDMIFIADGMCNGFIVHDAFCPRAESSDPTTNDGHAIIPDTSVEMHDFYFK
jgi:hypothetical protein